MIFVFCVNTPLRVVNIKPNFFTSDTNLVGQHKIEVFTKFCRTTQNFCLCYTSETDKQNRSQDVDPIGMEEEEEEGDDSSSKDFSSSALKTSDDNSKNS
jgi:hypothetical protein